MCYVEHGDGVQCSMLGCKENVVCGGQQKNQIRYCVPYRTSGQLFAIMAWRLPATLESASSFHVNESMGPLPVPCLPGI